jgi:hypothetical protein
MRGHALLNFEILNGEISSAGPGNRGNLRFDHAGPGNRQHERPGVHAWFLGVQHRIIRMANFISVGFTYKHADGNLTRITRQLSVPAPFKNESESMAHMKNKYKGCWCVVRQAQMQP